VVIKFSINLPKKTGGIYCEPTTSDVRACQSMIVFGRGVNYGYAGGCSDQTGRVVIGLLLLVLEQ
jgi:hypothetical protein